MISLVEYNATIHFNYLSYQKYHYMIFRVNHYIRFTSILVILFLVVSCDKNEEKLLPPTAESIAGTWIYERFDNGISEYSRAYELAEDRPGWIFHVNGKLTDRQNSGFCGTPPITYTNFIGNWQAGTDSKIEMNSKFWGGDMKYRLEIVSVSTDKMFVRIEY